MKHSSFRSVSALKFAGVAAALIVSAMFAGNKVQAQQYEFYVGESATTGNATTLLDYSFDISTGAATLTGTYSTGVFGNGTANSGALQLSGDGTLLSYAGFTPSKDTEVLFNLATKSFDTSTTGISTNIRSSWTQDGTSFYVAGGTSSTTPGYVVHGGSSVTTIMTSAVTSSNSITLNTSSGYLYDTRNSTTSGVYAADASTPITSPTAFTLLTGTNLTPSGSTYNGIGFLGNNTMFLADNVHNTVTVFNNATFATTPFANWNLTATLNISGAPIQQLSVDQVDANDALIFFTTSSGSGGTSTFDEVSFNTTTGFGAVPVINVLGTSTTDYFSGIASIEAVPEPDIYALFGLGLGFLGLTMLRKKVGQHFFLR